MSIVQTFGLQHTGHNPVTPSADYQPTRGPLSQIYDNTTREEEPVDAKDTISRSASHIKTVSALECLVLRIKNALDQFQLLCPKIPFPVDNNSLRIAISSGITTSREFFGLKNEDKKSVISSTTPNISHVIVFESDGSKKIFLVFENIILGEGSTKKVAAAISLEKIEDPTVAFSAKAGKDQSLRQEAATLFHLIEQIGAIPSSLDLDRYCQPPLLPEEKTPGATNPDLKLFNNTKTFLFAKFGGHSFRSILRSRGNVFISFEEIRSMFKQIAEGLVILHRIGTAHNDIKPANILFKKNPDGTLSSLITDFDLSRPFGPFSGGTIRVLAPETIQQLRRPEKSYICCGETDVWSFGVTLFMTLYKFEHGHVMPDGLSDIWTALTVTSKITQPRVKSFIVRMIPKNQAVVCSILKVNPSERPTASALQAILDAMVDPTQPPAPTSSL